MLLYDRISANKAAPGPGAGSVALNMCLTIPRRLVIMLRCGFKLRAHVSHP